MAGTTKRSIAMLGLVIATAGSLDHCAKDLARHLEPPRREQVGFGPVEFDDVGLTDQGGRIVEMVTVSTQPRSWNQASNLFRPWEACTEGRDYAYTRRTPAVEMEDEGEWLRERPKGTRFVQRVVCEGPLPNELEWTSDLLPPDAMQRVVRQLKPLVPEGPDGDVPGLEFRAGWFGDDYQDKRYESFNKIVGDATKDQRARCGGPVTLVDIATMSEPKGDDANRGGSRTLIVGMYFECATPRAAATPPTEPTATSRTPSPP
jgi:hypothetical protein